MDAVTVGECHVMAYAGPLSRGSHTRLTISSCSTLSVHLLPFEYPPSSLLHRLYRQLFGIRYPSNRSDQSTPITLHRKAERGLP